MSEVKKEKGFVARVMTILNLGEQGQLGSFESQVEKFLEKEISANKQNKAMLETTFKNQLEDLTDAKNDAQDDLENAWLSVDLEAIQTRADQKAYVNVYLSSIESAEAKVESIDKQITDLKNAYEDQIKSIDAQIAEATKKLEKFRNL